MDLTLYKKQGKCLQTEACEILYGGAAGGGKSHLLRAASIIFCINVPGLHVYLFRRTFKELVSNHLYTAGGYIEMLTPFMDDKLVAFNKSDYVFQFKNGSRIQLCHAQWESDIFNYQGAQIPLLLIDEATHFTEKMIRFLRSRVRLGSLNIPQKFKGIFPRIIYASNPGGVSHRYFKRGFVDYGTRVHRAPQDDGAMLRQYVPSSLKDNLILLKNDPTYADRLRGLGKAQLVEAMLSGDWDISDNRAIADWDSAVNIVDDFEIPHTWVIKRGYDYGFSAPYACLWMAISNGEEFITHDGEPRSVPKGSCFIVKELYGANEFGDGLKESVRQTAHKIIKLDKTFNRQITPGPADNSIFNREQGPAISDMMSEEGVSWTMSNKKPGSRINGLSIINQMITESNKLAPERPCMYFFSSCTNTVDQIPYLELDTKNYEDVDTEQEDHIYDVLRYLVLDVSNTVSVTKIEGL